MHTCGLFAVGAKCNRCKNGNNIFPDRGSNPVRWTQSPTLYHVAIKAGLYRKAVQVCYICITGDNYFCGFCRYIIRFAFHVNRLPSIPFTWNIKSLFLLIIMKIKF